MSLVKLSRIISVSSEDPKHPASNLLKQEISGCWRCKDAGEKQAVIILQLEKLCQIQNITIGNENSAFVELLVGKSAVPDVFEVLQVASVLMSVKDAKNDCNKNVVRFFKFEEFDVSVANQSWDRLKIICSQPFNKHVQYGLSFVKVNGKFDSSENVAVSSETKTIQPSLGKFALKKDEKSDDQPKIGSFFARRNDIDNTVSTAAAIRAASKEPTDSRNSPASKRLSDVLQDLKESKRKRKHDPVPDAKPSDDGRRSTAGPLLYIDSLPDDDTTNVAKKKKEDKPEKSPDNTTNLAKKKKEDKPEKSPAPKNTNSSQKLKVDKKSSDSEDQPNIQRKPFNRLLEDVVFVISGYQNPFRAELRAKAVQMGAKYKADWDSTCTHLICAFSNTPKSNQVKGKGWIVKKNWIEDCNQLRKRLKCAGYKLDKSDTFCGSSDEEVWEEIPQEKTSLVSSPKMKPEKPKKPNNSTTKIEAIPGSSRDDVASSIYDVDTDVDSDNESSTTNNLYENIALKILPSFFDKKSFYLGTDLVSPIAESLTRYIVAYKGNISCDVDEVNFIISEDSKYKENVSNTPVVLPDWIWECSDQKSLIPVEHFLIE